MGAPIIMDQTGQPRKLGNVARAAGLAHRWRTYGDVRTTPLFPRSQWDQLLRPDPAAEPYLPPVKDQGQVGQCNGDATASAVECCRAEQGLNFVLLSGADLYGQINHGVDDGSTLEDGLRAATQTGIGTAATAGQIWRPGLPPAPAAERARFRVTEAFLCPTFDHAFSAVAAGFKLISGVIWFDGYAVDAEGWLALRQAGESGGHAVFGFAPTKRGAGYGIWHQNSWGPRFGRSGRCVFPEQLYAAGMIGGWWAVREVIDEGAGVPPPLPD
jgi:hypothetical protein